jgi:hypothetical protein
VEADLRVCRSERRLVALKPLEDHQGDTREGEAIGPA